MLLWNMTAMISRIALQILQRDINIVGLSEGGMLRYAINALTTIPVAIAICVFWYVLGVRIFERCMLGDFSDPDVSRSSRARR